jgi:hypothetical protein
MKLPVALLLFCFSVLTCAANEWIGSSSEWRLPAPAYGQFRLVPSKELPHLAKKYEWNGPWSQYTRFALHVGFARGHQTVPGNFHFVEPRIEIEGASGTAKETHSTTVMLFNRASTPADIKITFHPLPSPANLDQEYHAATLTGDDAVVTWEVFVRFTSSKPDYVKAAKRS